MLDWCFSWKGFRELIGLRVMRWRFLSCRFYQHWKFGAHKSSLPYSIQIFLFISTLIAENHQGFCIFNTLTSRTWTFLSLLRRTFVYIKKKVLKKSYCNNYIRNSKWSNSIWSGFYFSEAEFYYLTQNLVFSCLSMLENYIYAAKLFKVAFKVVSSSFNTNS